MEKWTGKFSSTKYISFFVYGSIDVELINCEEFDYNTNFNIKYQGVYQHKVSLTGLVRITEGEMITTLSNKQEITFKVNTKNTNEISGTYYCIYPMDEGIFELHLGTTESSCNIQ